jgi:predicted ATPase
MYILRGKVARGTIAAMILRSIEWSTFGTRPDAFPFNVPAIWSMERIEWAAAVTFFVGENGAGKSTLLEALACAAGSITVGADSAGSDVTLVHARKLADSLRLVWEKKSKRGFFMRAEDFFGYARRMAASRAEMEQDLREIEEEYKDRPEAKGFAAMPFHREIDGITRRYGEGLDANSHGEGFLKLFQARFTGEGLYLLDEPEAALSPLNQLTFLALMHEMVKQGGQFIIATHSPMVLAYPGAVILSFDGGVIHPVEYDTLDHVMVTRDFLADPARYLERLLGKEA